MKRTPGMKAWFIISNEQSEKPARLSERLYATGFTSGAEVLYQISLPEIALRRLEHND
jgi:hypothetical protein